MRGSKSWVHVVLVVVISCGDTEGCAASAPHIVVQHRRVRNGMVQAGSPRGLSRSEALSTRPGLGQQVTQRRWGRGAASNPLKSRFQACGSQHGTAASCSSAMLATPCLFVVHGNESREGGMGVYQQRVCKGWLCVNRRLCVVRVQIQAQQPLPRALDTSVSSHNDRVISSSSLGGVALQVVW